MESKQVLKRNLWMFPLGTVGRDMVYCLFTNFLLTYILFTHSLTSGQLAAITAIMVGARVFDALNDPIMGNIIECTRTRFGKFKPWMLIGILSTSVVIYLAFNSNLQGWNFVIFFAFIYFFYSITYTMHDISYWGMVPALSSDAAARDQFTSRATLFAGIGSTIASIAIPMLTTGESALGGSAKYAYGKVALIIAVLAPLFLSFTLFGVREHREDMKTKPQAISLKQIFHVIVRNDQLIWVSLVFLIQEFGNGIVLGGVGSTYIYFEFGYEGGLYSTFQTVGLMATAFLMVFYPVISKRIHRKPLMKFLAGIALAGYSVMLLAGSFMPANTVKFIFLTFGFMLANFGQYGFYLIMMISIINTVEYNEYKYGERDEAVISSLRPFFTKMASALVVLFTSVCYFLFNVTDITNRISDYENAASLGTISETEKLTGITEVISGTTTGQSFGLLISMTVIPFALMALSMILYFKYYKLDEEEYNRICKELDNRKK